MPNFEDEISCLSVFAIKISPKYFKYFMKTSLGNSPWRPDHDSSPCFQRAELAKPNQKELQLW